MPRRPGGPGSRVVLLRRKMCVEVRPLLGVRGFTFSTLSHVPKEQKPAAKKPAAREEAKHKEEAKKTPAPTKNAAKKD